jgi:hypothetical protein
MRAQAFILEYGRGLNNRSEVYRLPADDQEIERLRECTYRLDQLPDFTLLPSEKQHLMFREVLGKYPPVLAEVMADDVPGETKTCLDIGCGSGGW